MTGEGRAALNILRSDCTIIKKVDRALAVVVWDREDYVSEADNQLRDPGVHQKLNNDPSALLKLAVEDAIGNVEKRRDIDGKTLEYFMVNNPKLGRFYLLPKIYNIE